MDKTALREEDHDIHGTIMDAIPKPCLSRGCAVAVQVALSVSVEMDAENALLAADDLPLVTPERAARETSIRIGAVCAKHCQDVV